jgi:hypothetical protein
MTCDRCGAEISKGLQDRTIWKFNIIENVGGCVGKHLDLCPSCQRKFEEFMKPVDNKTNKQVVHINASDVLKEGFSVVFSDIVTANLFIKFLKYMANRWSEVSLNDILDELSSHRYSDCVEFRKEWGFSTLAWSDQQVTDEIGLIEIAAEGGQIGYRVTLPVPAYSK